MFKRVSILVFAIYGISRADVALAATGGLSHRDPLTFAYSVYLYYKLDQQVLLGINTGQQQGGVPVLGSLYMRLPFGRVFLPTITGDLGYLLHDQKSGFLWKTGAGVDWKNGEHSSILMFAGYEKHNSRGSYYSRLGILLEF